jgi:hypothetical protein
MVPEIKLLTFFSQHVKANKYNSFSATHSATSCNYTTLPWIGFLAVTLTDRFYYCTILLGATVLYGKWTPKVTVNWTIACIDPDYDNFYTASFPPFPFFAIKILLRLVKSYILVWNTFMNLLSFLWQCLCKCLHAMNTVPVHSNGISIYRLYHQHYRLTGLSSITVISRAKKREHLFRSEGRKEWRDVITRVCLHFYTFNRHAK